MRITGAINKAGIDSVTGLEINGTFHTVGFSVGAQYNAFESVTVEAEFTGGLYNTGTTVLINTAIGRRRVLQATMAYIGCFVK